ncbi:unnamed protein product, partial [Brenthis ino]
MVKRILCYTAVLVCLNIVYGTPAKGLFCQDPDTGKLYPINSTWQSESFCGNYTCKLRKKNITETEYTPITKVNITKDNLNKKNNILQDDMSTSPSENSFTVIKNVDPIKQPVFNKDKYKIDEINADSTDRYLTESEISTITEILHTVKKSDLEAIIEIYNLAQEIYDEMDSTNEKLVKSPFDSLRIGENENKKNKNKDSISYWYEPLQYGNKKLKDLKTEMTNAVSVTKTYPNPTTYFNRPVPDKELMKMPYYYPVSNFQRMSSYIHKPYSIPQPIIEPPKPCNKHVYPPWYSSKPVIPQQPMLPYPFSYVHHYNMSYPASFYYNSFPWAQLDIYNRNKNYQQPYGTYFRHEISNAVPEETEVKDVEDENEVKEGNNPLDEETLKVPEWQTDEIPKNVLDEVKANIVEKSKLLKPLSLRKNIKLEKVGKVIKLDELLRKKRNIISSDTDDVEGDQFEAHIERTTCESLSTEPGYFRVGNASEPYPACCPQKIQKINNR